jgi:hypothetical protein
MTNFYNKLRLILNIFSHLSWVDLCVRGPEDSRRELHDMTRTRVILRWGCDGRPIDVQYKYRGTNYGYYDYQIGNLHDSTYIMTVSKRNTTVTGPGESDDEGMMTKRSMYP